MLTKNIIKACLSATAFAYLTGIGINNIYILIIAIILFFLYKKIKDENSVYVIICAIIFSIFAVLSLFQVTVYPDLLETKSMFFKILILTVTFSGTFFFTKSILSAIYNLFDKARIKNNSKIPTYVIFLASFILLILIYLPVWMMEFPSNIGADTIDQIKQMLSGNYVNHHPYAHTLWLKLLMSFGNDINQKIGIAALLQMIINSAVFSLVVKTIYKKTNNIVLIIIVFLFYALCSFNSFLSITLMKDVTHATITLLLFVVFIEYLDSDKHKILYLILICILSIAFCLFRTNGYFAYIVMLVVSIFALFKKDNSLLITIIISFILATIIKGPIYTALGVKKASFAESLSIPLQQIAYVIKNGYSVSEDHLIELGKIMDLSKVGESYQEFLSDPIKNLVNASRNVSYLENNKSEFFKIWLSIGLKHPVQYLRAWINQVGTFFSPKYYGTSVFWNVTNNDLGIVGTPIINGSINETLHMLAYNQHNIPIIGWFHYPAVSTWILFTMFFYSLRNKDKTYIFLSLLIGIFLTLMISCPYNICFRYYYSVVCCVPLMIIIPILRKNKET